METWNVLVLRHKPTGLYFGRDLEKTKSLRRAWRWYTEEELEKWIEVSIYAPEHVEQYEPTAVRISIELEV